MYEQKKKKNEWRRRSPRRPFNYALEKYSNKKILPQTHIIDVPVYYKRHFFFFVLDAMRFA